MSKIAGYWCFDDTKVDVQADSRAAPGQHPVRNPEPPTDLVDRVMGKLWRSR